MNPGSGGQQNGLDNYCNDCL